MTTLLFLPAHADDDWRWLRLDDAVVTRGDGIPEADAGEVIAVAPADAVTLHWATLPARSPAQATAAARQMTRGRGEAVAERHAPVSPLQ